MKLETKLEVDGFTIHDLICENKKGNKAFALFPFNASISKYYFSGGNSPP